MDMAKYHDLQVERTIEHILKKIDEQLDMAEKDNHLSRERVCCIKDCWKAIWYAKQTKH